MGLGEAPLGPQEDLEAEAGNVDLRVQDGTSEGKNF